jgi:hypothetical protein
MINTISDQDPTLDTITRITPSMCVVFELPCSRCRGVMRGGYGRGVIRGPRKG